MENGIYNTGGRPRRNDKKTMTTNAATQQKQSRTVSPPTTVMALPFLASWPSTSMLEEVVVGDSTSPVPVWHAVPQMPPHHHHHQIHPNFPWHLAHPYPPHRHPHYSQQENHLQHRYHPNYRQQQQQQRVLRRSTDLDYYHDDDRTLRHHGNNNRFYPKEYECGYHHHDRHAYPGISSGSAVSVTRQSSASSGGRFRHQPSSQPLPPIHPAAPAVVAVAVSQPPETQPPQPPLVSRGPSPTLERMEEEEEAAAPAAATQAVARAVTSATCAAAGVRDVSDARDRSRRDAGALGENKCRIDSNSSSAVTSTTSTAASAVSSAAASNVSTVVSINASPTAPPISPPIVSKSDGENSDGFASVVDNIIAAGRCWLHCFSSHCRHDCFWRAVNSFCFLCCYKLKVLLADRVFLSLQWTTFHRGQYLTVVFIFSKGRLKVTHSSPFEINFAKRSQSHCSTRWSALSNDRLLFSAQG